MFIHIYQPNLEKLMQKNKSPEFISGDLFFAVIFKAIFVQLFKIQKLSKGHVKSIGYLVQRYNSWILCDPSHKIVQS